MVFSCCAPPSSRWRCQIIFHKTTRTLRKPLCFANALILLNVKYPTQTKHLYNELRKKNAIFSINISPLCFLFESQKAEKALLYGCNCGMLVTTVYKGWRCAGERVRYLDSDNFTCEKKRWQTPTFTRKVLSAETALQLRTTGQRWDFSTLTPSSYNCIWF